MSTIRSFGPRIRLGFGVLLLCSVTGLVRADTPDGEPPVEDPPPQPEVVALSGATIHTVTDAGRFVGTVLVADGKITGVGPDVEIPPGARIIDLTGHVLTPGLIDCRSVTGLAPGASRESSSRGALDIRDGIDPFGEDWREVTRQGVTAVYLQPSNEGVFGGEGAVVGLRPADSLEELMIQSGAGVQAALGLTGANSRARYAEYQRFARALEAVWDGRDPESLAGGGGGAAARGGGRAGGRFGGRGGRGGGGRGRANAPSEVDRTRILLEDVLDKKRTLRLEVHHADVAEWALSLAAEYEIRIVLDGMSAPERALDELARSQTAVVIGPVWELGEVPSYRSHRSPDGLNAIAKVTERWALATFGTEPRSSRFLRIHAAAAIAHGIEPQKVLRAVTANAARVLGVEDRLGTVEVGKQADLAVFAGDPLDPAVPTRLVLSKGKIVHERRVAPRPTAAMGSPDLPASFPDRYLITSQRMWRDGRLAPGAMRIESGKIVAIGESIDRPSGMTVFDVGEAVVTPGLVVAHSTLGQTGVLADETESDASHFRARDVADPKSKAAQAMLEAGFPHVALAPASVNTLAGGLAQLRLGATDPVLGATIASKFVLSDRARNSNRFPVSLGGQIHLLTETLAGRPEATRLYLPPVAEQVLMEERRQIVANLIGRRQPAIIEAVTAAEIHAALELAGAHGLRATLLHCEAIEDSLPELRKSRVGILARPVSETDYDRYLDELARASQQGVPVAFAGDSAERIRVTAALAVQAGMSTESALRGLTSTAAELCGMKAGTGALLEGGAADFVIWTGSPLNLTSSPVRVVIAGQVIGASE